MLLVSTPRGPKNAKKTRISPRFQPCQSIGGMSSFKAPFKASKLSVAVTTGVRLRILFQAPEQSDSQSFDFGVFLCASKKELIELKKKCEDHSFYIKGLKKTKNNKQMSIKVQTKKKILSPKKKGAKGGIHIHPTHHRFGCSPQGLSDSLMSSCGWPMS